MEKYRITVNPLFGDQFVLEGTEEELNKIVPQFVKKHLVFLQDAQIKREIVQPEEIVIMREQLKLFSRKRKQDEQI